MKEVGKIYSAVDADELEAGDIVAVADFVNVIKKDKGFIGTLSLIKDGNHMYRFAVLEDNNEDGYFLAKLICPKKHAEAFWAWKNGADIEYCVDGSAWVLCENPKWSENCEYRVAVDPYTDLKKAYAEGKTIQIHTNLGWEDVPEPHWGLGAEDYRVKTKQRRFTNRELAKWLAQGNGQCRFNDGTLCFAHYDYSLSKVDDPCIAKILIRAWDEEEWHEPLVEE